MLKTLLDKNDIVVAPGCHDPLTAKIVESLGFEAVYLGGWAVGAVMCITEPLTTLTEMAHKSKTITDAVSIPLIVDGNACFGDATMALRTVSEMEKAGVAGIHIEDQVIPKRMYYHRGEVNIISTEEMMLKIKVACDSRKSDDFVIIARTDAGRNKEEDFSRAIERANLYAETGADLIMVFPRTMEEIKQAPKEIQGGLVFVASEGLGRPIPTVEELKEMGYRLVIYPLSSALNLAVSMKELYKNIRDQGHPGMDPKKAAAVAEEILELIAIPELCAIEDHFKDLK